jgi:hypothetical protein
MIWCRGETNGQGVPFPVPDPVWRNMIRDWRDRVGPLRMITAELPEISLTSPTKSKLPRTLPRTGAERILAVRPVGR